MNANNGFITNQTKTIILSYKALNAIEKEVIKIRKNLSITAGNQFHTKGDIIFKTRLIYSHFDHIKVVG